MNLESIRMSSPIRSDISIPTQLAAFEDWLKKHLPAYRQPDIEPSISRFAAHSYNLL
jgi:hypothetical protein